MESHERVVEWQAEYRRLERQYPHNPKVVYLASCYRSARGEHGVDQYIAEASVLARKVWKLGLAVICPVKNTAFFQGIDIPDATWLTGDFALLRRCDAVVTHPNWADSTGAQEEVSAARDSCLPVFHMMDDWKKLARWAKGGST